jgi:C-terminal processing protease CtpA/Prc
MKKILILFVVTSLLAISCRKHDEPADGYVSPEQARDSLYFIMKDFYYWYKMIPSVARESYSDPYTLLDAMMYKTLDRWSFVADYDDFMAEMEGTFVGHGFRIGLDESDQARITMIYNNSQLYTLGVRRGWIVKKVNGTDIAPLLIARDGTAYSALLGPSTAGITNTFLFGKPDGSEVTLSATKSTFTLNSVILYDTINLPAGKKVGHLVFESFIEPSEDELETAFAFFKASNVTDLILDLRYNSGGYLYVAQTLASYIAGNDKTSIDFAYIEYNDKLEAANRSFKFITTQYPLNMSRLVVITSRATASASEAVMNSLSPLIEIITVGDTTNGKPVGMNSFPCGKSYIFSPITFKIVNSLSQGDYFDGFFPRIISTDDITRDFDDRNESCLHDALQYIETGIIPGKSFAAFHRAGQFSEKPAWMNNTFVMGLQ